MDDPASLEPSRRRIVRAWYEWQAANLRSRGMNPVGAPPEYTDWLANTPRLDAGDLIFDIGDINYTAKESEDGWRLTKDDRGLTSNIGTLRFYEDVEKYLLCLMGRLPHRDDYKNAPDYRWYRQGVDPRVRLERKDPSEEYWDMLLFVDDESIARGNLEQVDAITFSHPLVMSYEQVDQIYREGLPDEWFTIDG